MWTFAQRTGELFNDRRELVAIGYAGAGAGKNNPGMQHIPNTGPLPTGHYTFSEPVDTRTHGPYVMWLTPDTRNEMYGRSAFGIHGDSVVAPGTASEGCIILSRGIRFQMWESGDHRLEVVSDAPVGVQAV